MAYTLEQLEAGIRSAHEAGNKDHVIKLKGAYLELKAQQEAPEEPTLASQDVASTTDIGPLAGPAAAPEKHIPQKVHSAEPLEDSPIWDFIQESYGASKAMGGPTTNAIRTLLNPQRVDPYTGEMETDEEYGSRLKMEYKERRRTMGAGEEGSGSDITGQIFSEIIDPLALTMGAASTVTRLLPRLAALAITGGGYEGTSAALEQMSQRGKIDDPDAIKMRAAIGAGAGPVADRVLALGSKLIQKHGARGAERALVKLENDIAHYRLDGLNLEESMRRAMRDGGLTNEAVENMTKVTGLKLEGRLNPFAPAPKYKSGRKLESGLMRNLDDMFGVLSTRIRNLSPAMFSRVRKFEMETHIGTSRGRNMSEPFLKALRKLPKDTRDDIQLALMNSDTLQMDRLLAANPELRDLYKPVREMLGAYRTELERDVGMKGVENFFPRSVRDYEGLVSSMGQKEKTVMSRALDALPADATLEDKAQVYNRILRGGSAEEIADRVPAIVKGRSVATVTKKQLQYYAPLEDTLLEYIGAATHTAAKARVFGRKAAKAGDNTEESFGHIIAKEREEGNITRGEAEELDRLLGIRFKGGDRPSSAAAQGLRNIFYSATLANPVSAVTQFGDVGLSAYLNGLRPTLKALGQSFMGRQEVDKAILGMDDVAQEMASTGATARFLNWTMRRGGFKFADRLGKNVVINSALMGARKQLQTRAGKQKFAEEWGDIFGKELPDVMNDLINEEITDNVKFFMWNKLSDLQPISLSELPATYLTRPGSRILYMLKTFTIKQMDLLRRDVYQKMKVPGQRAQAMKNLAKYGVMFGAANMTADTVKQWMQGKDVDFEDNVVAALWKNALLSEYTVRQGASGKISQAMVDVVKPPVNMVDDVYEDLANLGREFNTLKHVPVIGKMLYMHFGGGAEKSNEWRKKEKAKEAQRGRRALSKRITRSGGIR